MCTVQIRYLNGETETIAHCSSLKDVRIAVSYRRKVFAPEITLLDCGVVLTDAIDNEGYDIPQELTAILTTMPDSEERWNAGMVAHVELGDARGAEMAIAGGADINSIHGERDVTALMLAASAGNADMVNFLIAAGANIIACDAFGKTALEMAASAGYADVVRVLAKGVDTDKKVAALHAAIDGNNDIEVVTTLLVTGATVNQQKRGRSALHVASFRGSLVVVEALLAAGADANQRDFRGATALRKAVSVCNGNVVKTLLAAGTDLNSEKNAGENLLHIAAQQDCVELAVAMIDVGVDINLKNDFGCTALHEAAERNSVDVATILLNAGADYNQKNCDGDTSLHIAAANDSAEIVQLLLDAGICPKQKNSDGHTALQVAAAWNRMTAAKILLATGTDVDGARRGLLQT